jgi:hypothetical protein
MAPQAHEENLKAVVEHLALLDPSAGVRMGAVLHRVGWDRACEDPTTAIVERCRRLFGNHGVEFAEVIVRIRHGASPKVVAQDTTRRWTTHRAWERDCRTSCLARPFFTHRANAA